MSCAGEIGSLVFPGRKGRMIEASHPGHWRVDLVGNPRLVINCFMLPITSESYPQKVDSEVSRHGVRPGWPDGL